MQVRMEAAWDEAAEEGLLSDPRYEAATSLRAEGQYEAAVEFFEELLKTFDLSSKPPPHLAPLFFNLGSTLVCTLETGDTGDETRVAALKSAEKCLPTDNSSASISNNSSTIGSSSSIAPSVTTGTDSLSEPPLKRLKADGAEVSSATCAQQESTENADESGDDSNEESDEDDEAESEDDVQVAWQYLDQARSCYRDVLNVENSGNSSTSEGSTASSDCAAVPLSKNLHDRLTRALTRTISRLGDLNLLTQSYADALVEFEQVISLREGLRDSSIDGVCRLVDAYTQVRA
jgi:tetratricopeptide (TPR) repeat protein